MRILKNGTRENKEKKIRFVCKNCHCEFECNEDEYWENTATACLTVPAQYECFANCPQCHRMCKTYKTRLTDYQISVTGSDTNTYIGTGDIKVTL